MRPTVGRNLLQDGDRNMDEKQAKVLEAMNSAGKPVRPSDLAAPTGLTGEEVSKAIAALKKAGKIDSPKKCPIQ